jgi:hypothetical protein
VKSGGKDNCFDESSREAVAHQLRLIAFDTGHSNFPAKSHANMGQPLPKFDDRSKVKVSQRSQFPKKHRSKIMNDNQH